MLINNQNNNNYLNVQNLSQRSHFVSDAKFAQTREVSFTGIPEKLAQKVPESLLKNSFFHKALRMVENNTSLFIASFVLVLLTTLRPLATLAVPGAKKEDKQYAAAKSITSGIINFAMSALVYIPLAMLISRLGNSAKFAQQAKEALNLFKKAASNPEKLAKAQEAAKHAIKATKYIKADKTAEVFKFAKEALEHTNPEKAFSSAQKAMGELSKVCKFPYAAGSQEFKIYNYLVNYGSQFALALGNAFLIFKFIPPIVNKLFPERAKQGKFDPPPTFAHKFNDGEQRLLLNEFKTKFMNGGQAK